MYQTHPRTKGSTGFRPDPDGDYFRDPSYLGGGWKALPPILSSPRLGDRAFDLVDELNNRGSASACSARWTVPVRPHHELYAHMTSTT